MSNSRHYNVIAIPDAIGALQSPLPLSLRVLPLKDAAISHSNAIPSPLMGEGQGEGAMVVIANALKQSPRHS